jgi:hypothetical protein
MKVHRVAAAALTTVASLSLASAAVAADSGTLLGGGSHGTASAARPAPAPAPKAGAAVVVGDVSPAPGGPCGPAVTTVQAASAGPSFTVPGAGVITSYSYFANAAPGTVRANFFTPGPAVGHWTLVGKTPASPVTVSTLNTFPTRIPVPAGTSVGITISSGAMDCGHATSNAGDVLSYQAGFNPDTQTDLTASSAAGLHTNIAATWEPDADADGFGDVSQDLCPQSGTTQVACPAPDTSVKKPKLLRSGKVRIKFGSTIAGSTFTCAIDGKATKACKSPLTKRFSLGKHTIVVTAISPQGIADPTPFRGKFRIVRR